MEVKGDNGQIKRVASVPSINEIVTPEPFQSQGPFIPLNQQHYRGLDPLFLRSNILFEPAGRPPQRRFSQFDSTPSPPYGFPVTLSPSIFHPSRNGPSTIFHGPDSLFDDPFNTISGTHVDDNRRPLTRDHFLIHEDDQNVPLLLRPRGPDHKIPFGFSFSDNNFNDHNILSEEPTIITEPGGNRYLTNAHGRPVNPHFDTKYESGFLKPVIPRRTTLSDISYHSTLNHFGPSTPSSFHRVTVTPSPNLGHFSPSSPSAIFHKTTPRPNFEILSVTPRPSFAPSANPSYLPSPKPPASHAVSVTTFRPNSPPSVFLSTTPSPVFVTTPRPIIQSRPFPNRGSSKFKPSSHSLTPLGTLTGSDYSTQYQSGEHLAHNQVIISTALVS